MAIIMNKLKACNSAKEKIEYILSDKYISKYPKDRDFCELLKAALPNLNEAQQTHYLRKLMEVENIRVEEVPKKPIEYRFEDQ